MTTLLETEPLVTTDYAVAVDAATLRAPTVLAGEVRLLVAAAVGPVRLIDNLGVTVASDAPAPPRRAASPSVGAGEHRRGALT